MLFHLEQVVPGTECRNTPEAVQGQAASPCATANPQHPFLPVRRAAWPQQWHRTPVLTLARASFLGVEETKPPQEAMGEPPRAVVMKVFGGPDEICEVRSAFYDPSGLSPLPPPEKKVQSENILISLWESKAPVPIPSCGRNIKQVDPCFPGKVASGLF